MTTCANDRTAILVFARAPVAGAAKTRLIPALGAEGAARLHRRLTEHALATATAAAAAVQLWCTPDSDHPFFTACAKCYPIELRTQVGATLGERLVFAVVGELRKRDAIVVIGTDCPALTPQHLRTAMQALADHDAVIHPADDGGYVLIGLARTCPEAFAGIDWGSDRVFNQTMDNFSRAGRRVSIQETLWDVDTPADVERLVQSLPAWSEWTTSPRDDPRR